MTALSHPRLDQLAKPGFPGMARACVGLEAAGEGATLTHATTPGEGSILTNCLVFEVQLKPTPQHQDNNFPGQRRALVPIVGDALAEFMTAR